MDRHTVDQVPAQAAQRRAARPQGRGRRQGHLAAAGGRIDLAVRASRPGRPRTGPGRKTVRRHLLTGVLGAASAVTTCRRPTNDRRIAYSCKGCRGVSVRAEHVEPLVMGLVVRTAGQARRRGPAQGRVARRGRGQGAAHPAADLLARLDEIADERADGLLTGAQAKRATERIDEKLAVLEGRQQTRRSCRCTTRSRWATGGRQGAGAAVTGPAAGGARRAGHPDRAAGRQGPPGRRRALRSPAGPGGLAVTSRPQAIPALRFWVGARRAPG